jgi:hypothetical protein
MISGVETTQSEPAIEAVYTYRPAGVEGIGCLGAALFAACFNALNFFRGYMDSKLAIFVTVVVNLAFAAISGLVYCLVDEVKIGEDKVFETLYWEHPQTGARRVLKQYEFWRNDYQSIRLQPGRVISTISLYGTNNESITLDRIFNNRDSAAAKAKQIAEKLDLPLLIS